MDIDEVLSRLRALSSPESVAGMARYGINPERALGISVPRLRALAKELRHTGGPERNHGLAAKLWRSKIHEARILASMVDAPGVVEESQLEDWVREFNSWDLCDQCIMNLFEKTPFAWIKAVEWSGAEPEFVKRAGFVLIARLAVSDKKAVDGDFLPFLPIITREAGDDRNFVKKAVNWALRQIGKRSTALHRAAVDTARQIAEIDRPSARWIAKDALRELTSDAVLKRFNR